LTGEIAGRLADRVVVTSDNPRREPAQAILDQIVAGIPHAAATMKTQVEADRRVAILETVAAAGEQDVVLIAGKGHEDYQEIDGVKHPFSDADEAAAALKARSRAAGQPPGRPKAAGIPSGDRPGYPPGEGQT
jgi:UDP-N-acetylmuramoyl-L-alanyl-D-glutamate--2,6-diaminopimelate ligase